MIGFSRFFASTLLVCAGAVAWAAPHQEASEVPGKYVFIPDSLQSDVFKLLEGHSKVVRDDSHIDLSEMTIHNGDTIPMVLKDRNLGRFHRGLSNFLYVPKGMWSFGLTASYGEFDTEDLDVFGLLSDIDIHANSFSIKPYLSYFIKNNLSVGLRFGYTNTRGVLDSFKAEIDGDLGFNLHDISYRSESYTAAFTLRQYIGLSRRGRFGVFNEVELAFASGKSLFKRPYNGEPRQTNTTSFDGQLNFSPGVQAFIMKNVEFHVSFGVFGFYFTDQKQTETRYVMDSDRPDIDALPVDEPAGHRFTSGANFRFNIFNINFGIGVVL
ncbi:MAG: hypothetical protein HDS24_00415 [Bacteroides sp.]|nr:hypothetical protein [Bacteroides sp.]